LCSEAAAIFGWKFIPTLVTVIYTRFTAVLLENVQQTEPYVRMARPSSSVPGATYTILEKPRLWWITLSNGLRRNRNGGTRSWVIVLCCTVHIVAVLVISPLSAALLGTKIVQRTIDAAPMKRAVPAGEAPPNFRTDRSTFLRTTTALLQNYSSSPWVTDDYFILPFWPSDLGDIQWSPKTSSPQVWIAETHVFRADLQCSKLELSRTNVYERSPTTYESMQSPYESNREEPKYLLLSMQLQSKAGCTYNLTFNASSSPSSAWAPEPKWPPIIRQYTTGLGSWADINRFSRRDGFDYDARIVLGEKCHEDESIILSTEWCSPDSDCNRIAGNVSAVGYACSSGYSVAKMSVQATLTETSFVVKFDEDEFRKISNEQSSNILDLARIRPVTMASDFYNFVPQSTVFQNLGYDKDSIQPPFQGAASLLSTLYSQNLTAMIEDPDLPHKAARMRRRFFAEMLQTTFNTPETLSDEAIRGAKIMSERRVLVSMPVAMVVCSLSFVSFSLLIVILWHIGSGRRQLNSLYNLNTIAGVVFLIAENHAVLTKFKELSHCSRKELKIALKDHVFVTSFGALFELDSRAVKSCLSGIPDISPPKRLKTNMCLSRSNADQSRKT
jgi:hypothetical protein